MWQSGGGKSMARELRQHLAADGGRYVHLAVGLGNGDRLADNPPVVVHRVRGDRIAARGAEVVNLADQLAAVVVGFHAASFLK